MRRDSGGLLKRYIGRVHRARLQSKMEAAYKVYIIFHHFATTFDGLSTNP